MKKKYQSPRLGDLSIDSDEMLLGVSGNNGISYGGVDVDGSKDPAVRHGAWDDEDEEWQ